MANPDPSTLWVIRVPAVQASIAALGAQRIHSAFMMYLYLRTKAREGKLAEASPMSQEMKSLLDVPGNSEKPFYLPMLESRARDSGPRPGFWRAPNLSGLWSPATLGRAASLRWMTDGAGHYAMPSDNADLALANLLYGNLVSAVATGGFLLRNQVFLKDEQPTVDDLIDTFRPRFGFPPTEEADFAKLFHTAAPVLPGGEQWFEPAPADVLEVLIG